MIEYVIRQLTSKRPVRNGLRYRDAFTSEYRRFIRLRRQVEAPEAMFPREIRDRVEAITKNNRRAISFRLMSRAERKAFGCGPRMIAEPSEELKTLIDQVERHLANPQKERTEEIAERKCRVRATVGLAAKGH